MNGLRWSDRSDLTSERSGEGSLPQGPAANKENSFILLHTSADKRSEGVSGVLRGGRQTGYGRWQTGLGTRGSGLRFSCSGRIARHFSLVTCHSLKCRGHCEGGQGRETGRGLSTRHSSLVTAFLVSI